MRQSTVEYLTSKLPEIRRMVAEGLGRRDLCDTLGCSHATLRTFLKVHGIVFDELSWTSTTSPSSPGSWNQFKPNQERLTQFTHAELKYRSMDEHRPDELEAILAKLRTRMPVTPQPRLRVLRDLTFVE